MKQGPGSSKMAGTKREPISHKVNEGAVAQLGNKLGNAAAVQSFYGGMGYKTSKDASLGKGQGPGANRTVHPHGSQRGK